ncbi:MAG TPA: DUF72 domain-containing protein, partial [Roseiflexaceae bacterium]|nr:DUF72 domain-containing protein [Roseiflexaceae bacterium]
SDFLRLYSQRLTTVEGNTTFYAIPREEIVQRWAAETPPEFRFCFKIPQDISRAAALDQTAEATRAFVERMAPLGPRLGPFFLQLPPSFHPRQIGELDRWLAAWPQGRPVSVEVRHSDWFSPTGETALMALLARHNAGRVLMDVRPLDQAPLPGAEADLRKARDNKPDVPLHPVRSSDIVLVRYIGHPNLPANEPLLDEWAARVAEWLAQDVRVYFFMHCPSEQFSPTLCRMLQRRLDGVPGVPPLPWNEIDDETLEQGSLF